MNMKIKIIFTAIIAVLLTAVSCMKPKISDVVKSIKKGCPMSLGMSGSIDDVEIENNFVTFKVKLNDEFANIKGISQNKETFTLNVTKALNKSENTAKFMNVIADEGYGLKYFIEGYPSGDTVSLYVTADMLRESSKSPKTSKLDLLQTAIENSKMQMPMQLDELTTLTDMKLEGDNVVYFYEIEEDGFSVSDFDMDNVREGTIEELQNLNKDVVGHNFITMVVENDKNLIYRYKGKQSGQVDEVLISNAELSNILHNH